MMGWASPAVKTCILSRDNKSEVATILWPVDICKDKVKTTWNGQRIEEWKTLVQSETDVSTLVSTWVCEVFSGTWHVPGNHHFFSARCWWCPDAWACSVMTIRQKPWKHNKAWSRAVIMGLLQPQPRAQRMCHTLMKVPVVVTMKEGTLPPYLSSLGSGNTSQNHTWWPCGSSSPGSANSVSTISICPQYADQSWLNCVQKII